MKIEHTIKNKVMHLANNCFNLLHDVSLLDSSMLFCCVLQWMQKTF
jgi:hypothetical protein